MIPDPLHPPLSPQTIHDAFARELDRQAEDWTDTSDPHVVFAADALKAGAAALRALSVVSAVPRDEKDHGGTSLTEGASVSVSVPTPRQDEP